MGLEKGVKIFKGTRSRYMNWRLGVLDVPDYESGLTFLKFHLTPW